MAEAGHWVPLVESLLHAHIRDQVPKEPKEPLWQTKCLRAAQRSLNGGWGIAFRALQADHCPPNCEETFQKVSDKFLMDPLSPADSTCLLELCRKAIASATGKADNRVTIAKIDKRLRCLKKAAQPGNAKGKNTHLFALLKAPYGKTAVRMWALAWIKGEVPQVAVDIWTKGFVKPLSKKGGTGVRPISLFETCLKIATGVALDVSKRDIINAVGTFQYGALLSAGADKMVYNLRALSAAKPKYVFIATDIANAFGTVPRLAALRAILKHVPFLAPIFGLLWRSPVTSLLVPRAVDQVDEILVTQGVFQGECLSTAVFCVYLRTVIDAFYTALQAKLPVCPDGTGHPRKLVTILAYVDDVVLCFDPSYVDLVWPTWIEVLATHGLKVEPTKCKAWVPGNFEVDQNIQKFIPVVTDGLPVLGTAAQSAHSTLITTPAHPIPMKRLVVDVHKRLELATSDAELLINMAETTTEMPVRYAAWLMLVRSLAVRLDFDMRILPADILSPIVTQFTATLLRVAKAILHLPDLSDPMMAQAQLPGQFGGLFLTNPFIKLQVAHLASMAASWKHTFHWAQQQGLSETEAFTSIDTSHATNLLEDLHTSNIWINVFGMPCPGQHPDRLLNFESPLLLELKALQGRLTNVLYDLQAKTLWADLSTIGQTRLLSAGGTGNGAIFRSPTKLKALHLDDMEFRICVALRLGHPIPQLGICRNRTQAGRTCHADPNDYHPLSCKVGGGVAMLHTAVSMQLSRIFKQTGALVRREVPIPEFTHFSPPPPAYDPDDVDPEEQAHLADAIMDVVAHLPTGEEYLIDASIRNPLAQRYAVAAFSRYGFAADCGEQDKRHRYPLTKGKKVEPCVIESFGRLGTHFHAMLDQAVHLTNKFQSDRSGGARNLKDEWLTDISATLSKVISRNYRNSICGNMHGDPPVHTLFPSQPQQGHPSARLSLLRSPLCTMVNQPQRCPSPWGAPAPASAPPPAVVPNVGAPVVTSVSPLAASLQCTSATPSPPLSPGTLAVNVLRDVAAAVHPHLSPHVCTGSGSAAACAPRFSPPGRSVSAAVHPHLSPLVCTGSGGAAACAPRFSPPGRSVSVTVVSPCHAT
jgi:hypothetical protein